MTFRDYVEADVSGVAALYVQAFSQPPWTRDGWTEPKARERLTRYMSHPDAFGLVAEEGGDLVGFALGMYECFATGEQFFLREMATAPARQRSGIGGALLAALRARLLTRGVRALYLHTQPRSPAAAFYQKHGFVVLPYQLMSLPFPG